MDIYNPTNVRQGIKTALICFAALLAVLTASIGRTAQPPITNGSFESGDYTGWTLFESQTASFCKNIWSVVEDGSVISLGTPLFDFEDHHIENVGFVYAPIPVIATDGDFVAFTTQNCISHRYMQQDIALCSNATRLEWDMAYKQGFPFFIPDIQTLRVELLDPSDDSLLLSLFETVAGDPETIPMTHFSEDVSPFAGQSVRLRASQDIFVRVMETFFDNFHVEGCDVLPVGLDIKPGSDPNCFNINGHGVVPAAILGTADFDVGEVDPLTLSLAGLEVRVRGNRGPQCGQEDVNYDGFPDLVCQFVDDPLNWEPGDSTAVITGELWDGTIIEGEDTICVVPE